LGIGDTREGVYENMGDYRGREELNLENWRQFERHLDSLIRTALYLTCDDLEAEDMVWHTLDQFSRIREEEDKNNDILRESDREVKSDPLGLMCRNYIDKQTLDFERCLDNDEESPEEIIADILGSNGSGDWDDEILSRIPEDRVSEVICELEGPIRMVVVLSLIERLSYAETASITGLETIAVKKLLDNGRNTLRRQLLPKAEVV